MKGSKFFEWLRGDALSEHFFLPLPHPHSVNFPPLPLTILIVFTIVIIVTIVVTVHVSFTGGQLRQGLTWTCFLRIIQLKSM